MKILTIFALCLVLLITNAYALSFTEHIDMKKGILYTKTGSDNGMVHDQINSIGNQSYDRELYIQKDETSLNSNYNLRESEINQGPSYSGDKKCKIGGKNGYDYYNDEGFADSTLYNSYAIQMKSANGLSHFINVLSKSTINTQNTIILNKNGEISTNYSIESGWGDVHEGVLKRDSRQHPIYLAETRIQGQPEKIGSTLTEIESMPSSEEQYRLDETKFQQEKLESVDALGEIGREEHSVPRTNAVVETKDGKIEIEKQDKSIRIFGNKELDVSAIKPKSAEESYGLIGEEEPIGEKSDIQVSGVILVGQFDEMERETLLSAIEAVTGNAAEPALEEANKASGYALIGISSKGHESDLVNYMKSMTKSAAESISRAKGIILIGEFDQLAGELENGIENALTNEDLILLAKERGALGQATSFALIRDSQEMENLSLIGSELQSASLRALNHAKIESVTEEQLRSATLDVTYGLFGEYYPGEKEAWANAIQSVEDCQPSMKAVIGANGTLCRVPSKLQLGRIGRTDGYFKGVIKEI
jgi:hypothetical protein